jgi:hypothetical protein
LYFCRSGQYVYNNVHFYLTFKLTFNVLDTEGHGQGHLKGQDMMSEVSHLLITQKSCRKKRKDKIESVEEATSHGQGQESVRRGQGHEKGQRNIGQGQEKGQREGGQRKRHQASISQDHDLETKKSIEKGQGRRVLIEMAFDWLLCDHVTYITCYLHFILYRGAIYKEFVDKTDKLEVLSHNITGLEIFLF